jgi:hypothetical protein
MLLTLSCSTGLEEGVTQIMGVDYTNSAVEACARRLEQYERGCVYKYHTHPVFKAFQPLGLDLVNITDTYYRESLEMMGLGSSAEATLVNEAVAMIDKFWDKAFDPSEDPDKDAFEKAVYKELARMYFEALPSSEVTSFTEKRPAQIKMWLLTHQDLTSMLNVYRAAKGWTTLPATYTFTPDARWKEMTVVKES